jgi:phosphoribosylpyrophosphate synthetase
LVGVPCVRGNSHVVNFYRYWPITGKIRRLTIAPLFGEAIHRIADESSVSSLFD